MKINFQLFDLAIDKIQKQISYYLDLQEDRVIYHIECIVDKAPIPEEEIYESDEDVYTLEHTVLRRECLTGASLYCNPEGLFCVELELANTNSVIKINFEEKPNADKLMKQLLNYIFPKNATKPVHDNV